MNTLYAALPLALDPVGGGSWTTAATSTVNGAHTFTFGCPVAISGAVNMSGTASVTGTIQTTSTGTIIIVNNSDLELNGAMLVDPSTGTVEYATPKSFTRVLSTPIIDEADGTSSHISRSIGVGQFGTQEIDLPNGATITAITLFVDPDDGGSPVTKVQAQLIQKQMSTGTPGVLESLVDPTASGGAYDAYHSFTMTVSPTQALDTTLYKYYVQLNGEDTSAVSWHGASVTYTVGEVDLGH
jgi:hypothetical protein